MQSYDELLNSAKVHYQNITADINNASTRLETVRLTALAQEAANLLTALENFGHGLVYSHSRTARDEYRKLQQLDDTDVMLDGFETTH